MKYASTCEDLYYQQKLLFEMLKGKMVGLNFVSG